MSPLVTIGVPATTRAITMVRATRGVIRKLEIGTTAATEGPTEAHAGSMTATATSGVRLAVHGPSAIPKASTIPVKFN